MVAFAQLEILNIVFLLAAGLCFFWLVRVIYVAI